jgi:DNA-binding transcriptional regulator GbsR (MarR family)
MDYKILEQLVGYECISIARAFSIKKLSENTKFSEIKIRQTMKLFLMCGLVREGAKDGNRKTYYITNEGYELYKEVMDYNEEDIEKLKDTYLGKEEE